MVVLVDANIILDFLLELEPFVDEAKGQGIVKTPIIRYTLRKERGQNYYDTNYFYTG
ncbi:hypothetical protein AGMMS49944_31810 [Spirochaetia bacterium]|nr:hypothetical protein AGMMS49944_31810 [Spirochaetia bacterium]